MMKETRKKRKLAELETQDTEAILPRKSRVVKNWSHEDSLSELRVGNGVTVSSDIIANAPVKSKSESRQAKSERRSKKAKSAKPISTNVNDGIDRSSNNQNNPDLADNADYVSLEPETTHTPGNPLKKKGSKAHKINKFEDSPLSKDITNEKPKKERFILFIGNLPYTATTAQIQAHFTKLAPKSIRHSTNKATGRSKGFAFLEFQAYDKMKTCLKLYHHSIFSPEDVDDRQGAESGAKGSDKRSGARRINVELTAGGGGGKSAKRKEKIKVKNRKLEEERERQREREMVEEKKHGSKKQGKGSATGANATVDEVPKVDDRGDIHPSRMNRVT